MTLQDTVRQYYINENYNCAETCLHASNDYYQLGLDERFMKSMGGFGGGMFSGLTCGALIGFNAALSLMLIENKAHEELDVIRPASSRLVRNFRNLASGTGCPELRPVHHSQEHRCLKTCLLAAQAMEQTLEEIGYTSAAKNDGPERSETEPTADTSSSL